MTLRIKYESALRRRAALETALRADALTLYQMEALIDTSYKQAREYRDILLGVTGEKKLIYVAGWLRVHGGKAARWVPQYRWMVTGEEEDVAKPEAINAGRARRAKAKAAAKPAEEEADTHERDKARALRRLSEHPPAHDLLHNLFMRKAA